MERGADGLEDGDDVRAVGEAAEPEEPLELLQPDHDGRSRHEADDGRVRQEIHQEPQPAETTLPWLVNRAEQNCVWMDFYFFTRSGDIRYWYVCAATRT